MSGVARRGWACAAIGAVLGAGLMPLAIAAPAAADPVPPEYHLVDLVRIAGVHVTELGTDGAIGYRQPGPAVQDFVRVHEEDVEVISPPTGAGSLHLTALAPDGGLAAGVDDAGRAVFVPADSTQALLVPGLAGPSGATAVGAGTIVGYVGDGDAEHAFTSDGTTTSLLPTLPGWEGGRTRPFLVADDGAVVGTAAREGAATHLLRWVEGVVEDLGSRDGFELYPSATAGGSVVGSFDGCCSGGAFLADGTGLHDLGTFGGRYSAATSVNTAGDVVGSSQDADGHQRAFVSHAGGPLQDLGTLGGDDAHAHGIDDAGTIVGTSTMTPGDDVTSHGFVVADGVMYDVNDLVPAGTATITGILDAAPDGRLLVETGFGSGAILLPGAAPGTPSYEVVDLAPGAADLPSADALNELDQVLLSARSTGISLWSAGTTTPIGPGVGTALSDTGVVGGNVLSGGTSRGFTWDGTLHLVPVDAGTSASVQAVNDAGDASGFTTGPGGARPFVLHDGTRTDLLAGRVPQAEARDVNERGQVAAFAYDGQDVSEAFFVDGATTTPLGDLGQPFTYAAALNDAGVVVGSSHAADGHDVAFAWDGTLHDIGPVGSTQSEALAVNDLGVVAGAFRSDETAPYAPFLWDADGGWRTSEGLGGSFATLQDLNDAGVAVGYGLTGDGAQHALRFDGSETVDLNRLVEAGARFEPTQAVAINERGTILAVAESDGDGRRHPVLLVPTAPPAPVSLAFVGDVTVGEDEGVATVGLLLSGPAPGDVTGTVVPGAGSAQAGQDFSGTAVPFTIPAGEVVVEIEVAVVDDQAAEPDEAFALALAGVQGAPVGTPATATVTIEDDDVVPAVVTMGPGRTVVEGNAGTTSAGVTVTLDRPAPGQLQVGYSVVAGSAGVPGDVAAGSGSVTLPAGASSAPLPVSIVGDALDEANETFSVTLTGVTGPGALGTRTTATVTITDDDAAPTLRAADATVVEGAGASVVISLSAPSGRAVSVAWATQAGTATAADFVAAPGQRVTIPAGATSVTIPVATRQDAVDEPQEQFTVVLSAPANATIADGSAVVRIDDDDPAPTLSVSSVSMTEGQTGTKTYSFVVRLSGPRSTATSVTLATVAGTATSTGTQADFTAATRTLSIAATGTTATFAVVVRGDRRVEPDETFTVRVTSATAGVGGVGATGTGTIRNDD